jgi:hypothetical protein
MDQRERLNDLEESLRAMLEGHQSGLWTAMIGTVVSYNATGHNAGTATIQPSIKSLVTAKDGSTSWQLMATLPNVPVAFMGGGNFVATYPIQPGDEALVVFCSRCIAAWYQNGAWSDGGQIQAEMRMHDLSDGVAFIGPRSMARSIPNLSADTAQFRSMDGTTYFEVTAGGQCNIVAPQGLNIQGDVTVTGKVTATEEGTFNNIEVSLHEHSGVTPGSGTSGPPVE